MLPVLVPAITSKTEKADMANGRINNTKLMSTWPKLIININYYPINILK